MTLPRSRKDREQQKFVDDGSGNVAVRAVVIGGGGGAVSSVSNSNGTLTISPTTGAVVASLNLGNANEWTAQQTLGANARFRATSVTGGVAYLQFETGLTSGSYVNQFGASTTVPADTTAGWNVNAIFADTDATTFNRTWINIGTSASSEFRRIATLNASGQLAFENGTAALPAFSFSGDPDTGAYSFAANNYGISTGGTVRTIINSSGLYVVPSGSTTVAAIGLNNSQGNGFSSDGNNINFIVASNERARITSLGAINFYVGGTGAAGDVAVGRDGAGGIFMNCISGQNVELRTNNVARLTVASSSIITSSLPFTFGSSTLPGAASTGIGRSSTDLSFNVPTGSVFQDRINATNITTTDAGGINIVPSGTAATPALTLGGFESGLYLTGAANTAIASQAGAVAEFINGGRIDFLAGGATITGGNFSIGRNTTNTELYLNAPTGNVIATRVNNVVNARFGGSTVGLYGVSPVARATTGIGEAAIVANAGAITVNEDTTFGGYTLQQVVQALQSIGILT